MGGAGQGGQASNSGQLGQFANPQVRDPNQNLNQQGFPNPSRGLNYGPGGRIVSRGQMDWQNQQGGGQAPMGFGPQGQPPQPPPQAPQRVAPIGGGQPTAVNRDARINPDGSVQGRDANNQFGAWNQSATKPMPGRGQDINSLFQALQGRPQGGPLASTQLGRPNQGK